MKKLLLALGATLLTSLSANAAVTRIDTSVSSSIHSRIDFDSLTPEKIYNLALLGKVWGFLKYHHPAVTFGKYDWDRELFRILPSLLACKNQNQRNDLFIDWIDSLGKFEPGKPEEMIDSLVKLWPDTSWINAKEMGAELATRLNRIRNANRSVTGFYVSMDTLINFPVFKNEKAYASIAHPDAGIYLLSLFRYWNMIQYFFPYRHLLDENWHAVLKKFIPTFIRAKNEQDYLLACLELIAKVSDTHANIWGTPPALEEYRGRNFSRYKIAFVENQAVVTGRANLLTDKLRSSFASDTVLQKGDVLLTVGGKSVERIVEERLTFSPASNHSTQLRDIARNLLRSNDSVLHLTFLRNDSSYSAMLPCYSRQMLDVKNMYKQKDTCFRYLEPGIACIYPGTIKNAYLPQIMPEVMKSKGLVIDMRCYPPEFIVYTLSEYLLPDTTPFSKFTYGSEITPGLFMMTGNLSAGKKNPGYFKGKVVILVNEITQSQAEFTTMAFRTAPNATVIGSSTAGADGNVSKLILPGNYSSMISGLGIYYPDGRETQRIGIVPDVVVKPTVKGILEGRDEVMERAVEIIKADGGMMRR